MKPNIKLALSLSCIPAALAGISHGATLMPMPSVRVDTVLSTGPAAQLGPVQVATVTSRPSGEGAPAANSVSSGRVAPSPAAEPSPTSGTRSSASEEGPSKVQGTAPREEPGQPARAAAPSRTTRTGKTVPVQGTTTDAKGVIPPPEIVYDDPGAFHFTAVAGYATKHIWRGIDLAQFTSYNYLSDGTCPKADSDVTFIGANATYKGFLFGMRYIETIDDNFNPFFNPYAAISPTRDLDSYAELVLTLNYTRMLVGPDWLQGTFGFDFYYYPNGLFWGVDNQGMIYARFSSPHFKWAQPYLELFYNIATDSQGNGLASENANDALPPGINSWRGATGSELVEGGGFELGVNGGDRIFANDNMSIALTYSISTIYKSGYAFEDDGFSQLVLTVGAPITFGSHLTITPSISYVEALSDITPKTDTMVTVDQWKKSDIWNSPGWVASVKASWQF